MNRGVYFFIAFCCCFPLCVCSLVVEDRRACDQEYDFCPEGYQCREGGCVEVETETDGDSDSDSDTDIDLASDGDGDVDSDSDFDGETDADSDTESDGDSDSDDDSDYDVESDIESDGDSDRDADSDYDVESDIESDIEIDGDSDSDADGEIDADSDSDDARDSDIEMLGCGDGTCHALETAESCPGDCPAVCGDGLCTHAEDDDECYADCGSCGDGRCATEESLCSCSADCSPECGDGVCASSEAGSGTCPADCAGPGTWVQICAGTFVMGSPLDEGGRDADEVLHEVRLTHNIEILSTEVTQAEFERLMSYNHSSFGGCGGCPVEQTDWYEAAAYCNALSLSAGLSLCYFCSGVAPDFVCTLDEAHSTPYECPGYRLPTEAEWEYVARSGTSSARYGDIVSVAWYEENSGGRTHDVGTREASPWGIFDMLGSVWEWCHDAYDIYPVGPVTDPIGSETGSGRVIRGGSWNRDARFSRAAYRGWFAPDHGADNVGFRPIRSLLP